MRNFAQNPQNQTACTAENRTQEQAIFEPFHLENPYYKNAPLGEKLECFSNILNTCRMFATLTEKYTLGEMEAVLMPDIAEAQKNYWHFVIAQFELLRAEIEKEQGGE